MQIKISSLRYELHFVIKKIPFHYTKLHYTSLHYATLHYTHTPKSLQCLHLISIPNQNAHHDPCPGTDLAKPISPLETLALTNLGQTIMALFVFNRIPFERRFPTGLFSCILLMPTNKNAKQALFLVCILQDNKETRSKTRYGKSPHLHTWTLARKPQTCPSLDHW